MSLPILVEEDGASLVSGVEWQDTLMSAEGSVCTTIFPRTSAVFLDYARVWAVLLLEVFSLECSAVFRASSVAGGVARAVGLLSLIRIALL